MKRKKDTYLRRTLHLLPFRGFLRIFMTSSNFINIVLVISLIATASYFIAIYSPSPLTHLNTSALNRKQDHSFVDIWANKPVIVKIIPESEVKTFHNKMERGNKVDFREDLELQLTPPIITAWAYELGFALSEGFFGFNCYCVSVSKFFYAYTQYISHSQLLKDILDKRLMPADNFIMNFMNY